MFVHQVPIKELKNWQDSDVIDGCALDNRNTSKHHQIFSVERLPDRQFRLNYVICYPERDFTLQQIIPDNFIDLATSAKKIRNKEARHQFNDFSRQIMDDVDDELFVYDDYKKGLNFSFTIEPTYLNITNVNVHNCDARIESVTTYNQANKDLRACPFGDQLKFFNKFTTRYKIPNARNDLILPFEDSVNILTKVIQNSATEISHKDNNNIECLYRRKHPSNNRTDKYCYINSSQSQQPRVKDHHWVTPITSSQLFVSAINEMAFYHHNETGKNLLRPELAEALAIMSPYAKELKNPRRTYA